MTPRLALRLLSAMHGAVAVLSLAASRVPYLAFLQAYKTYNDPAAAPGEAEVSVELVAAALAGAGLASAMMVLAVTTLSAALCLLLWRRLAYGSCRVCAVVLILLIPLGTIPGAITFLALRKQALRDEFVS